MILRILPMLGSFASLAGLIVMIRPAGQPFTVWQGIVLGVAICLFAGAITLEIRSSLRSKPLSLADETQIRDYMYRWISRGGRVAIFSRDMSWVRDEEMKEMLLSKAHRNELCICLPHKIPLVEELAGEGAEVCVYPELEYVPKSRFTIINRERADAQVAVGRRSEGKHVIQEFAVGDHPFSSVANDLVEVIVRFDHWKRSEREEEEQQ